MKKIVIAATLGMSLLAGTIQPAQARIFFGMGFGHPFHHHYCHFRTVRVKVWSPRQHRFVWRLAQQRVCW